MSRRVWNVVSSRVGGRLVPLIGLLCFLLAGLTAGLKVSRLSSEFLPIRHVRVEGVLRNLEKTAIAKALAPMIGDGYLGIDLRAVERAGRSLAWVDKIQVERIWPDILRLKIREQTPYFRLGKSDFLNAEGERFGADNFDIHKELPRLNAPRGKERTAYLGFIRLDKLLAKHGLKLVGLSINERHAWSASLASGVEILLGRKAPLRAFDRFVRSLWLFDELHLAGIKSVDLRYDKGFAVSWKAGARPDWKQVLNLNNGEEVQSRNSVIDQARENQGIPETVSNKLKTAIWRKKPTAI